MEHCVCYPLPQDSWRHAPSTFQKILFQSHAWFLPKKINNQWIKPCQVRCILYHSRGSFDHSRAWQRTKGGSPRPWVQSHLRYWRRCPPKPAQAQKNQSQSVETKQIMQRNKQKCEESWQVIRSCVFWRRSEDCNYMTFPSTIPGPFASRNASPGWYPKRAQAQRLLTMSCAQLEHRMDLRCLGFLYPFGPKNDW